MKLFIIYKIYNKYTNTSSCSRYNYVMTISTYIINNKLYYTRVAIYYIIYNINIIKFVIRTCMI